MKQVLFYWGWIIVFAVGCSKKQHPQVNASNSSIVTTTPVVKKATKKAMPIATTITVDDRAAKKAPDGRMYYDLEGKRYWKNFDDGKYYRYSKKMYNNPSFRAPALGSGNH